MLKLIKCEFWKLKRKHFVSFVVFAALLFPIPFTALVLAGSVGNFTGFDAVFGLLVTLGEPVMLPIVLGIVAAMLFFMERDNDTLKNLHTIPISPTKIASAKIAVLFILGLIYSLATLLSSMVGGLMAGSELVNIGEKIWISIITSLLYTASTLPVVIIIVGLNRSYIFSIILTFFYTMFDYMLAYGGQFASEEPAMKLISNIFPAPTIYRWQAAQFVSPDSPAYSVIEPYGILFMIPTLFLFDFKLELTRFANLVYLFNIIYLGLGASALCFVTWNFAVKVLGAVKTSVYIYMVPVITVVTSVLILHEKITVLAGVGTLLTLAGLFLSESKAQLRKEDKNGLTK